MINTTNTVKNIGHYLKKHNPTPSQLSKLIETNNIQNRNTGSLPTDWIQGLKKQEIPNFTKQVQDIFADFAKKCHNIPHTRGTFQDLPMFDMTSVSELQKGLLDNLKSIFKTDKIKIEFVGSGQLGKCHALELKDRLYALKTFHPMNALREGITYNTNHGKGAEIGNSMFVQHCASSGTYPKFFTGRVGRRSDKDAFILTKFITPENAKAPKSLLEQEINFVTSNDAVTNSIGGTVFESGAIITQDELKDSKFRYVVRELAKAVESNSAKNVENAVKLHKNNKHFEAAKQYLDSLAKEVYDPFDQYRLFVFKMTNPPKAPIPIVGMQALGITYKQPLKDLVQFLNIDDILNNKYLHYTPQDIMNHFNAMKSNKNYQMRYWLFSEQNVIDFITNKHATADELKAIGVPKRTIKSALKFIKESSKYLSC